MTRTKSATVQSQQDLFRATPLGGRRWHELQAETPHTAALLIAQMFLEKHLRDRNRLHRGSSKGGGDLE